MQSLEVSGAVRPLKWPLGVKWLIYNPTRYDVKRDLVPPPPETPIVLSTYWFYEQPDDGPLTRPKHVVVYYIKLHIT
jgi:hypothetical protein